MAVMEGADGPSVATVVAAGSASSIDVTGVGVSSSAGWVTSSSRPAPPPMSPRSGGVVALAAGADGGAEETIFLLVSGAPVA